MKRLLKDIFSWFIDIIFFPINLFIKFVKNIDNLTNFIVRILLVLLLIFIFLYMFLCKQYRQFSKNFYFEKYNNIEEVRTNLNKIDKKIIYLKSIGSDCKKNTCVYIDNKLYKVNKWTIIIKENNNIEIKKTKLNTFKYNSIFKK